MFDSFQPHGLQHTSFPCLSPTPGACSNSCPLSRWCHPTISSSIVPFSSHLQSFPASGYFPMSQFFASGGQSIGISASVLPMNIQDWFPLGWTGWISLNKARHRFKFGQSKTPLTNTWQLSSVTLPCPTLCDPMNCSTPGLPVHHQLLEFTQTHVHWVSDANQSSHPLSSPSPPALSFSQHQSLFKWVSSSHQVAKVLEFQLQHQSSNEHPGLISFRMDWLDLLAVQKTLKRLL